MQPVPQTTGGSPPGARLWTPLRTFHMIEPTAKIWAAVSAAHSTLRPETCATTSRDRASPKLGDLFHQKRRRGLVIEVLSGVGVGGRRVPFDERKQRLAPFLVKRA